MAWIARILNTYTGDSHLHATVEVGFFDDADPKNTPLPTLFLYEKAYDSMTLTTVPEFVAQLQADGAAARTQYETVNALIAQLPIGAQVVIAETPEVEDGDA
jgi:hypothetical protein